MRTFTIKQACIGLCMMVVVGMTMAGVDINRAKLVNAQQLVGSGKLTWWGLTVYRAALYAQAGNYVPDQAHALRIEYEFSFTNKQLAERSLKEMEKIFGTLPNREQVLTELLDAIPSVKESDVITGVHAPGQGAVFYLNDLQVSQLNNPDTAGKFFSIWLNAKTSEPDLRMALLGEAK